MKEYTVSVNGMDHTMLLNEEDAKRYGHTAKGEAARASEGTDAAPSGAVSNKARTTASK